MPRIVHWFPVSHDINSDPEVWELTDKFGDRALRVWLQMLSVGDRNDGLLKGKIEWWAKALLPLYSRGNPRWINRDLESLKNMIRWTVERGWTRLRSLSETPQRAIREGSEDALELVNYVKYHKRREQASSLTTLSYPTHTKEEEIHKEEERSAPALSSAKADLSVQDLVESWNESFEGRLPLVQWPLSSSRHKKCSLRIKEHSSLGFWQTVFNNINSSSFLLGGSSTAWRCTLDFVIGNDTNCVKIFEGVYNGKSQSSNFNRNG